MKQENTRKGIAAIVASAFGFALMAFFVRLCDDFGGPVNCFQKSFVGNIIALAIAFAIFAREDTSVRRGPAGAREWGLLFMRAIFGGVGIFGNFYALSRIPIGEAMTLNKMAPFFTVVFTALFLKERVTLRQILCLAIAFTGAMLVMKPGFQGEATFATICALGGGLGAGIAYTCVRELGVLGVNGAYIVLFFSAFSTIVTIPVMFMLGFDPMTPVQFLIMTGAGIGAAIGQFGVTAAYRYAQPRKIAVFDYTNIIFTSLFGFMFFGQIPDALSVAGFLLIVAASVQTSSNTLTRFARSLLSGAFFLTYGLFALPFAALLPAIPKRLARSLVRIFYRLFVANARLTGLYSVRIDPESRKNLASLKGAIVVMNHVSLIDICVLMAHLPDSVCIAKASARRNPFLGAVVSRLFIANDIDAGSTLEETRSYLSRGVNVIVFPQGTRGGKTFHRGAARLALDSKAPLAAVHVEYDPVVLAKGQPWSDVGNRTIRIDLEWRGFVDASGENSRPNAVRITDAIARAIG